MARGELHSPTPHGVLDKRKHTYGRTQDGMKPAQRWNVVAAAQQCSTCVCVYGGSCLIALGHLQKSVLSSTVAFKNGKGPYGCSYT